MQPPDLVSYLAEFDLTLADLRPEQTAMFLAARSGEPFLEDLQIAVGTQAADESDALREREADRAVEVLAYTAEELESRVPTDDMDVAWMHTPEDLPRIFPSQWLMDEVYPEVFSAKLAQRELLMPQWKTATDSPQDRWESSQELEIDGHAAAESAKPEAYVLLDTSRTMRDRDRRGAVARGLAIAFLRAGFRGRARLNVRPFTAEAGERLGGFGSEDFGNIVRRVVELPNAGQTRIQAAIEQAVDDIRRAGPCLGIDILLISDGLSRLKQCPLDGERLHTILVGDLLADSAAEGTIDTLKQWSTTFHRLWKNRFAEFLTPSLLDCQAAARAVQEAIAAQQAGASLDAEQLARLLENAEYLLHEFKQSLDADSPQADEAAELARQLREASDMPGVTSRSRSEGRDKQRGQARRGLRSSGRATLTDRTAWWQRVRQWVAWLRNVVRRCLRMK